MAAGDADNLQPTAVETDPAQWVQRHGDLLYRYALARLGNAEDAHDAVQEALLGALRNASTFDGRSSESTWLVGILRHKVYAQLRRRSRDAAERAELEAELSQRGDTFTSEGYWTHTQLEWRVNMGDPTEREEFLRALDHAISDLPPMMRRVVYLYDIDGLDAGAVSEILGISRGNLWVLAHRARARLRTLLDERLTHPQNDTGDRNE
jgi:RNA polymerase sigma factor (sigma-70 family)